MDIYRIFLGRRSIMIQNRKLDISEFRWAHLSRLGDSEARRYILGSKARHVVSHFLLVLPETGFALKAVLPFIIEEMSHRKNFL